MVVEAEVHLPHQQVRKPLSQVFHLFLLRLIAEQAFALAFQLPAELDVKLEIGLLLDCCLEGQQERLLSEVFPLLGQLQHLLNEPADAELPILLAVVVVVGLLEPFPLLHALDVLPDLAVDEPLEDVGVIPQRARVALEVLLGNVGELSPGAAVTLQPPLDVVAEVDERGQDEKQLLLVDVLGADEQFLADMEVALIRPLVVSQQQLQLVVELAADDGQPLHPLAGERPV